MGMNNDGVAVYSASQSDTRSNTTKEEIKSNSSGAYPPPMFGEKER